MGNHKALLPSSLNDAILQTAAYADVFDFALTGAEVHRYLIGVACTREEVDAALCTGILSRTAEGTYTLPGREMLGEVRRRREAFAAWLWPRALRVGGLIARLPFVRMVAVTGALAMNNMETGGDVDFLIVTSPGRLWFCRGLVLLAGRLGAGLGVTVCPNYLVSLQALKFPEQTLYTAHEVAQMAPLAGMEVYDRIRQQNSWAERFLPNAAGPPVGTSHPISHSLDRPTLETVLQAAPFSALERWEMNRKVRKLRREQAGSPESDFSADVCKGHAHRHGARVRAALAERLNRLQGEGFP